MITDYWFYITAIPAVLIYGIGKGGFGGALGIIAVPMMALSSSPIQAASVLLPILCLMDVFVVRYHYRYCSYNEIITILPAAILGIITASILMDSITESFIEIFIGSLSLLFCLQHYDKNNIIQKSVKNKAYIWGFLSGLSSTFIHAGGGPITIYLLTKNLNKHVMIGTMAIFFALLNLIKIIPYIFLGELNQKNILTSLCLMPLAPIGVKFGVVLLKIINEKNIYKICYLLLFTSGVKLLFSGLTKI